MIFSEKSRKTMKIRAKCIILLKILQFLRNLEYFKVFSTQAKTAWQTLYTYHKLWFGQRMCRKLIITTFENFRKRVAISQFLRFVAYFDVQSSTSQILPRIALNVCFRPIYHIPKGYWLILWVLSCFVDFGFHDALRRVLGSRTEVIRKIWTSKVKGAHQAQTSF